MSIVVHEVSHFLRYEISNYKEIFYTVTIDWGCLEIGYRSIWAYNDSLLHAYPFGLSVTPLEKLVKTQHVVFWLRNNEFTCTVT